MTRTFRVDYENGFFEVVRAKDIFDAARILKAQYKRLPKMPLAITEVTRAGVAVTS